MPETKSSFTNSDSPLLLQCDPPELEFLQVVSQVVSLHLDPGTLVGHSLNLPPQLPHLLLVHLGHAAGPLAVPHLLDLYRQRRVLLLQEAHLLDVAGKAVVEVLQLSLLVGPCVEEVLVHGVSQVEVEFLARVGAHGAGGTQARSAGARGHAEAGVGWEAGALDFVDAGRHVAGSRAAATMATMAGEHGGHGSRAYAGAEGAAVRGSRLGGGGVGLAHGCRRIGCSVVWKR